MRNQYLIKIMRYCKKIKYIFAWVIIEKLNKNLQLLFFLQ